MGDTDAKISIYPILASLLLVSILRILVSVCNNTSRVPHVPAERLFSKAGELVSARRNRLKPKQVNTYLFLNKNMTSV